MILRVTAARSYTRENDLSLQYREQMYDFTSDSGAFLHPWKRFITIIILRVTAARSYTRETI